MQLLTSRQIDRVHEETDYLGLKRLAVIVPLPAAESGSEMVMPDGNLLICAPYGGRFDAWFAGLRERLSSMNLSRIPRADQLEPPMLRVPLQQQASGMRRYLDWREPSQQAYDDSARHRPPSKEVRLPPSKNVDTPPAAVPDEAETTLIPDFASVHE